jgi:Ca-activated chloride channel homolog
VFLKPMAAGAMIVAVAVAAAALARAPFPQTAPGESPPPGTAPPTTGSNASKAGAGTKVASPAVKLWVLAEGRGRNLVLDLRADNFQVSDDGHPQQVTYFAPRSSEPLSLGILIETSRSRMYEPEPVAWQAYSNMLRRLLRPGDQAFIATFAEKLTLESRFTENFKQLDAGLRQSFDAIPEGTTALYDSLYDLCEEPFGGVTGRKAVLVLADSADDSSFHTQVQTLEQIQRSGVAVYFLLPWIDRTYQPSYGASQAAQLFAGQTGGLFFIAFGRKPLLDDIDGVAAALAYTYTLGYTPPGGAQDGRFHSVKVKCNRRGVKVDASSGYYAGGK